MTDRLRKLLDVLAVELGDLGAVDIARAPRATWSVSSPAGAPMPQLGHGGHGAGDIWVHTSHGVPRGLVVRRSEQGLVWQVDDGRGLIVSGTARRAKELLERAWGPIVEHLVDPVNVVMRCLQAASELPRYRGFSAAICPFTQHPEVLWTSPHGGPITIRPHGGHLPFPSVEYRHSTGHFGVWARQLAPTGDLGRQLAGAALRVADQLLEQRDGPTGTLAIDHVRIDSAISWRPGGPPAALWDACRSQRKTTVDGRWSERLDDMLEDESPAVRARRVKMAQERIKRPVHLPKVGDDGIDALTGKVVRYEQGADRTPFKLRTVAGLYLLGLGARLMSEVLVGDHRAKNSVHRRMQEIRAGGDHWAPVDAHKLLEQMGFTEHVRPAAPPGAPPVRPSSKPGANPVVAVRVRRRNVPVSAASATSAPSDLPERWAEFVSRLPDTSRRFIELLEARGAMSTLDVMQAFDLAVKPAQGIIISIMRWAPIRGLPLPFERVKGESGLVVYVWTGLPGQATRPAWDDMVAQAPEGVADFLGSLRADSADFLRALYRDSEISMAKAVDELAMPSAERFTRYIHHRIVRWASASRTPMPYEVIEDGNEIRAFRWVGWPESEAA